MCNGLYNGLSALKNQRKTKGDQTHSFALYGRTFSKACEDRTIFHNLTHQLITFATFYNFFFNAELSKGTAKGGEGKQFVLNKFVQTINFLNSKRTAGLSAYQVVPGTRLIPTQWHPWLHRIRSPDIVQILFGQYPVHIAYKLQAAVYSLWPDPHTALQTENSVWQNLVWQNFVAKFGQQYKPVF